MVQLALGGGSLPWDAVKAQIVKTDPELIKIIEATFIVSPQGGGVRMGPQFGDRHGDIIAPFRFEAVNRKTKEKVILVIQESDDFQFTDRFKFTLEWPEKAYQAEQPGAGHPASKPANKAPAEVQPPTSTSKDGPR